MNTIERMVAQACKRHPHIADDIAQEVLIAVWRASNPQHALVRARGAMMDLIRKEYRLRCKTPVELVPFEDQIGGFDEPHETPVLTDDLALLVAIALNSQQKVADAFGVSHVTIFNRSKKARARVEACV